MPQLMMPRMRFKIGAIGEVLVVKSQIKMMRLEISQDENRGNRAGEFAEAVKHVLRHRDHALFEFIVVNFACAAHSRVFAIRAGRVAAMYNYSYN